MCKIVIILIIALLLAPRLIYNELEIRDMEREAEERKKYRRREE